MPARTYDDARRLRDEDQADDSELSRRLPCPDVLGRTFVAKTKTVTTYPTAALKFYAMESQEVLGAETEGGSATFSDVGDTFHALNLGSAVPPSGTRVKVEYVPYRYVFRYDG